MKHFDISEVIEKHSLDKEVLAKSLFPNNKYPRQAFERVLKGEAELSVGQLEMLANYIGVLVPDLFTFNSWADASENGHLAFKKGPFLVKVNYAGAYITIFKDNKLVDQVVSGFSGMPFEKFIDYIDNLIKKY